MYSDVLTIDNSVDCGPISVDFYAEEDFGSPIDFDVFDDNQSFDMDAANIFSVLNLEDQSKVGTYSISYRVYHSDYPENYADNINAFTVTIDNPCQDASSITATLQELVDPYLFTGDSPSIVFNLNPFEIDPRFCPVTFTCSVKFGPRSDLCSIIDGETNGSFDQVTGNYQF